MPVPSTGTRTVAIEPETPASTTAAHSTSSVPTPSVQNGSASPVPSSTTTTGAATATAAEPATTPPPLTTPPATTQSTPSRTVTAPLPANATARPPGEPDPASARDVLSVVLPPVVASAVTATSASSVVVSSALSTPAAATGMARLRAVGGAIDCVFTDDSIDPTTAEFPFQFQLPLPGADNDDGQDPFATLTGAVVVSTALTAIVSSMNFACFILGRSQTPSGTAAASGRIYASVAAALLVAFFAPSVAGAATTVAVNSGSAAHVAMHLLCLAAMAASAAPFAWALLPSTLAAFAELSDGHELASKPQEKERPGAKSNATTKEEPYSKPKPSVRNKRANVRFVEAMAVVFDAARSFERPVVRSYFAEDVLSAVALSVIAGVRPSSGSCEGVGVALLLVAALHVGYLAFVWPYRTRLESVFAMAAGVVQLGITAAGAAWTAFGAAAWALDAVGWLATVQAGLFVAQPVAIVAWMVLKRRWRTAPWRRQAAASAAAGAGEAAAVAALMETERPLLGAVPVLPSESESVVSGGRSGPASGAASQQRRSSAHIAVKSNPLERR